MIKLNFERGGVFMTRAQLKSMAKAQIKGNIGILFVIAIVATVITGVPLANLILVPALGLGLVKIYLNMTNGQKPKVGDLFSGLDQLGRAWWLSFLIGFFTSLWSMLFFIPGIVKALSYSMAHYVLADHPEMTARQALNESKRITQGHKGELFVLNLSFLGWQILACFTFGILYIWLIPYMQATVANFYRSLTAKTTVEG